MVANVSMTMSVLFQGNVRIQPIVSIRLGHTGANVWKDLGRSDSMNAKVGVMCVCVLSDLRLRVLSELFYLG